METEQHMACGVRHRPYLPESTDNEREAAENTCWIDDQRQYKEKKIKLINNNNMAVWHAQVCHQNSLISSTLNMNP